MFTSYEHRGRVFKEEVEKDEECRSQKISDEEKHALPYFMLTADY